MHRAISYEMRFICMMTDFLSQKDVKVYIKGYKNIVKVYSAALFYKLFLSEQPYFFKF